MNESINQINLIRVCENKDFCNIMLSEDTKTLEFHQHQKSE